MSNLNVRWAAGMDMRAHKPAGSPFPAGPFPVSVAVDPTGKFAYVANQLSNNVNETSCRDDSRSQSSP